METLHEYIDSPLQALRIDKKSGILHGVRILGYHSRNGRRYSEKCLNESSKLYENAKVNVNHAPGHEANNRDYRDRIGSLHQVHFQPGEGLYADFHYNPKHPLTEQLLWDAEHAPANVGFSHHVEAETMRDGDEIVVTSIHRVISVDLVADPATTNGLFESCNTSQSPDDNTQTYDSEPTISNDITTNLLEENELRRQLDESQSSLSHLQERLTELEEEKAHRDREKLIQNLLADHHLPLPGNNDSFDHIIISEIFLKTLFEASDDMSVRQLIIDRKRLLRELGYQKTQISSDMQIRRFAEEILG